MVLVFHALLLARHVSRFYSSIEFHFASTEDIRVDQNKVIETKKKY